MHRILTKLCVFCLLHYYLHTLFDLLLLSIWVQSYRIGVSGLMSIFTMTASLDFFYLPTFTAPHNGNISTIILYFINFCYFFGSNVKLLTHSTFLVILFYIFFLLKYQLFTRMTRLTTLHLLPQTKLFICLFHLLLTTY